MRLQRGKQAAGRMGITDAKSGISKKLIDRDSDRGTHRSNTTLLRGCATKVAL